MILQPAVPSPPIRPGGPAGNEILVKAIVQEVDGPWRHLRGLASIETTEFLLEAEEMDYNTETGYAEARGNVRYKSYESGVEMKAERAEYYVNETRGRFYEVSGSSPAKIDARPGVMRTDAPFYFQGSWAERVQERYYLYDGIITNCRLPKPWWVLKGSRFDISPNQRALAYNSRLVLRSLPILYAPVFYKSLERMPRKSGFLTPSIGTSSRRGFMIGTGYYWAINRSYDLQYRNQYFTSRGFAHTVDFRGKPTAGSDFNAFVYGVNDKGLQQADGTRRKAPGFLLSFNGRTELPYGFEARGVVNYLSSYSFRREFTESFNEAIFTEVNSIGFITRQWSTYSLNLVFQRNENIQTEAPGDTIVIRKLPQLEFASRDQKIEKSPIPLWFSFGSAAGLVRRNQPLFQTRQFVERLDVEPRVMTALHWKGFHLIPAFSIRETYYGSSVDKGSVSGENVTRSSREFTTELIMPSLSRIFDAPRWMGTKLKHVIEPRASFRYVNGIGNFDDIVRFDGMDIISNTSEAQFSVTNRLYAKAADGSVREVLSWQLAQRRFFDPDFGGAVKMNQRNVVMSSIDLTGFAFLDRPRNYSPVVSTFRANPISGFGVEWQSDYDPLRRRITNSSFTVDARISRYLISAGHTHVHCIPLPPEGGWRPGDIDKCTDTARGVGSFLSPPANQLRWLAGIGEENKPGWNGGFFGIYDYRTGRFLFGNTQVTYRTDCCSFSLQYRRFDLGPRHENQFRFALSIANIGSFGTLRRQERLF